MILLHYRTTELANEVITSSGMISKTILTFTIVIKVDMEPATCGKYVTVSILLNDNNLFTLLPGNLVPLCPDPSMHN